MSPMRRWLYEHAWNIQDETICFENGRYYLSLLAERNKGGLLCHSVDDASLILPVGIRDRVFATARELAASSDSLPEYRRQELEFYQGYISHHLSWVTSDSLRSDSYDEASGISAGVISKVLAKEHAALQMNRTKRN